MPIVPVIVTDTLPLEVVPLDELRPHFRNYQTHGPDELAHLQASLRQHGWYKNVVVASDGTLLAGHGIVEAARAEGMTHAPVRRLPYPPTHPEALKVLVGDNEQGRLALRDEPRLAQLLHEIYEYDAGALLGTGFDVDKFQALGAQTGVIPPVFAPVGIEEQGQLDQKKPLECPACGHVWTP